MELSKKIKQLRLRSGMTQEQLANRLGVGAQSVSKWENAVAMPDITLLPLIASSFGVSIDDLFDLTTEQRLNRIESRMDMEEELAQDVFREYEEFLKSLLSDEQHKKRATELLTYLYWHRMDACAKKVSKYGREAVRMSPGEKGCQWMLQKAEGHQAWDWNIWNHSKAINFYMQIVEENPECLMPYYYLLDNLIADRRSDEAEKYLEKMCRLEDSKPVINEVYRAHIALARFDKPTADSIITKLLADHPDDWVCLFEAAQYYAESCDYQKAIELYELSFEKTDRRPRYIDELQGIADIYEIMGDYKKAADTYDRIIAVQKDEWGMTEETELKASEKEKARLLALIK